MNRPPLVWCDVDGVLRDIMTVYCRFSNLPHGPEGIVNYEIATSREILSVVFKDGFWKSATLYDGALEFLCSLYAECGEALQIATAPISVSDIGKNMGNFALLVWVLWVPLDGKIHISGRKELLFRPGDIIIDDSPEILNHAQSIGAFPICIGRPWNQSYSDPGWDGDRYDFDGAVEAVKKIFQTLKPEPKEGAKK